MIVIYTPKVTNRIKYTLDFVFTQYFGIPYSVVESPVDVLSPDHFYICYAPEKINGYFSVFQDTLLLETDIRPQRIFISKWESLPVFFSADGHFDVPFDILSAIFFMLSRYEEYLPHDKDQHGRYLSSNSVLSNPVFQFGPIVESWLSQFRQRLLTFAPQLRFSQRKAGYIPTFDIDQAYRFLGRNWLQHPPNILRKDCWKVLTGKSPDPYDTYDFILQETAGLQERPRFFILTGNASRHDTKVSMKSRRMSSLLQRLKQAGEVGIHPSYDALAQQSITAEKHLLEELLQQPVTISRQHFLRISFPAYYYALLAAGITMDYSLAYPDTPGFRAGCSVPFVFYNLISDQVTSLVLQPSCWMDATYEYYLMKKSNEIYRETEDIIQQLSIFNGNFVPIYHNDVLAQERYRQLLTHTHTLIKKEYYDEK